MRDIAVYIIYDLYDRVFVHLESGIDDHARLFILREIGVEIEKLRARLVRVPPRKRVSRLVRARRRLGGVRTDDLFQKQLAVSHIGDRRRIGGGPCAASVAAVAASVTVAAAEERTACQCERKDR